MQLPILILPFKGILPRMALATPHAFGSTMQEFQFHNIRSICYYCQKKGHTSTFSILSFPSLWPLVQWGYIIVVCPTSVCQFPNPLMWVFKSTNEFNSPTIDNNYWHAWWHNPYLLVSNCEIASHSNDLPNQLGNMKNSINVILRNAISYRCPKLIN